MVMVVKKGTVPSTPHTEFYAIPNVLSLEEIHGTYVFNGPYSRKIHLRSYPTEQSKPPIKGEFNFLLKSPTDNVLQPYLIFTSDMPYEGNSISGRRPILFAKNTIVSVSKPESSMEENTFFRNGEKHEIYYVQNGEGILKTEYGDLKIRKGF